VLRTYQTTRAIPIVVCTGSEDPEEDTARDGYNALVRKPCTPAEVEATVVRVLGDDAPPDSDESNAG
jgi:CheY-like chemotaxis protein